VRSAAIAAEGDELDVLRAAAPFFLSALYAVSTRLNVAAEFSKAVWMKLPFHEVYG